jgi:hypothetical protein
MSILERLRRNDPELTELRLVERPEMYFSDLNELIEALDGCTYINYVRLDRNFVLSSDQKDALLQQIGKLESLEELHVWSGTYHVLSLANVVEQASNLKVLDMGRIVLEGDFEDFRDFGLAFYKHSIEAFLMTDIVIPNHQDVNFDSVVRRVIAAPCLNVLKLDHRNKNAIFLLEL